MTAPLKKNPFVRYLREFRDLKTRVFLGNVFAVVQAVSLVPVSLFFKTIIDTYIPQQNALGMAWMAAAAAALWSVNVIATTASRYFTLSATKTVTERLRARLTFKLQQLSLRFHDNEKAANLHARVVLDTERVDVMANALVVTVLVSLTVSLAVAAVLAWMNLRLFLLLALMLPFYWMVRRRFESRLKEGNRDFRAEMQQMSAIVSELLHSIRLVKSFANEDHEQRRVEERIHRVTNRGVNLFTQSAAFQALLQAVGGVATVVVFVVGGLMVVNGRLTIGEVVAFSSLMALFLNPVNALIATTDVIYAGQAGLESVYSLMDVFDTEATEHLPSVEVGGQVVLDHVSFGYNSERTVLEDVSLEARSGDQIALVGSSGAGKTTLINLILGFYKPTRGKVAVDGNDVTEINLRNLREQIGVVSQDNVLLSGSIRDNIRYGRLEATETEIEEAARLANAHEFIAGFPDGYDSQIGDRGVKLSGGQRQRIAIARAILKNPRILILDEATSALDSESEHLVQEALDRLRANRTSFVIAHRLSTVQNASRIVVLGGGRIIEQGSFDELIALRGEFFRFHQLQFKRETRVVA